MNSLIERKKELERLGTWGHLDQHLIKLLLDKEIIKELKLEYQPLPHLENGTEKGAISGDYSAGW